MSLDLICRRTLRSGWHPFSTMRKQRLWKFILLVQRSKDYPEAEPECDPGLENDEDPGDFHHTTASKSRSAIIFWLLDPMSAFPSDLQSFLHDPKGTDQYFLCVRPILQIGCDLQKDPEISILLYVPVRTQENLTTEKCNMKKIQFPEPTDHSWKHYCLLSLPSWEKGKVTESAGNSSAEEKSVKCHDGKGLGRTLRWCRARSCKQQLRDLGRSTSFAVCFSAFEKWSKWSIHPLHALHLWRALML